MVEYLFICRECGNIQKDARQGTSGLKCNSCNSPMDWSNSFPPLNALDFIYTAELLLEQSKLCDKQALENQYKTLKEKAHYDIDKTLLDKYRNQYEAMLAKYPDNDDTVWMERLDRIEDEFCKLMDEDQAILIYSTLMCGKNRFRKPYIIIVASLIEQLFNDYVQAVIYNILPAHEARTFLNDYETAGIQTVIDAVNERFDGYLKLKMDTYCSGFYDKWASLRKLRNSIIHSNTEYVTKKKVSQIQKLIDESLTVFSQLKSEIYAND